MKKILTVSLVAMMAVTAARAEIATTTYVDNRTGDVQASTYVQTLAEGKKNLAGAVDQLSADISKVQSGQLTANTVDGAAIKNGTITTTQLSTTIVESLGKANTALQTEDFNEFKTENSQAIANAQSAAETTAANALNTAKTELGTTITNTAASTLSDAKAYTDLLANGAVKTNTEQIGTINTKLSTMATSEAVTNLTTRVDAAEDEIDAITADYLKAADKAELSKSITDTAASTLTGAKAYTDELANGAVKTNTANIATNTANIATNTTNIATNTGAIAKLNGTGDGSVSKAVADAKSELQGKIDAVVAGGLTPGSVDGAALKNGAVSETQLSTSVNASLDLADSALQKADIATGAANGTISVEGTDVAVKGLGTAAYSDSGAFATSAQGAKADAAMNWASIKDTSWTTAGCNGEGVVCSLVSKGGNIGWEKVVD